jgi:hypothetical protein
MEIIKTLEGETYEMITLEGGEVYSVQMQYDTADYFGVALVFAALFIAGLIWGIFID